MKIIVDAFGGDNAPLAPIQGAVEARAEYGVDIILTGDEAIIKKVAAENHLSLDGITIVHAPDVFTNDDQPSTIRSKAKANTSMAVGLNLLNNLAARANNLADFIGMDGCLKHFGSIF